MTADQPRGHTKNKGGWSANQNADPEVTLGTNPEGVSRSGDTAVESSAKSASLRSGKADWSRANPVECDRELAVLWEKRSRVAEYYARAAKRVDAHHAEVAFFEENGRNNKPMTRLSPPALAKEEAGLAKYESELDVLDEQTVPIEAEFVKRGGWTRFFLVRGTTGHVHKNMSCSKCRPGTAFAFLPEMSGSDEAQTVELAGDSACTACFPSAPVVNKAHPRKSVLETVEVLAERARKTEAAAAKADKANADSITAPAGDPLQGADGRTITSERNAEKVAADTLYSQLRVQEYNTRTAPGQTFTPREHEIAEADAYARIVTALAAKRGTDVDVEDAALRAKVQKKFDKDYK